MTGTLEKTSPPDGGGSSSRSFWKYWAASAASTTGDGITSVALPLLALTLLGASNFEVGLLAAAGNAAVVLIGLPAGVIVRRFALRGLQLTMDGFRAVMIISVPVAAWLHLLTLAHLVAVAFLVGLANNLFDIANATFVPQVVPKQDLIRRNGLLSGTLATTQVGGPAVGGLLVQAVGAAYSVVVDAVTYVVSALFLSRIPETGRPSPDRETAGVLRRLAVGISYVARHPVMRPNVFAATAVNFASGALTATTAPFLVRTLHLPAGAVGLVVATDGLGAVIGAAAVARSVRRVGDARVLLLATAGGAVTSVAMPLAAGPWAVPVFAFGMMGLGAGVTMLSVIARTHRQTVSPPDLLSRVVASVRFVSWSAIPFGALVGGAAAQASGPRAGLVVVCVAAWLAPLAVSLSRVRTVRSLVDAEEPAAP